MSTLVYSMTRMDPTGRFYEGFELVFILKVQVKAPQFVKVGLLYIPAELIE